MRAAAALLLLVSCRTEPDAPADGGVLRATVRPLAPRMCEVSVAGSTFRLQRDANGLAAAFRTLRQRYRSVAVTGPVDTPYECVGSTVYLAQRAGFREIDMSGFMPAH